MSTNVFRLSRGEPGLRGPTGPAGVSVGGSGPTGPIGPTGAGSSVQSGFEQYENLNGTVTRSVTFDTSFSNIPSVLSSIEGDVENTKNISFTVSDITTTDFNLNVNNSLASFPSKYNIQCKDHQINLAKQGIVNDNPAVIHSVIGDGRMGAAKLDYVRFNETEPDVFTLHNEEVTVFEDTDKSIDIAAKLSPPNNIDIIPLDLNGKIVDGNPAIAYRTTTELVYARNTESDGTGEWVTQQIDEIENSQSLSEIAILPNGNPCIATVQLDPLTFCFYVNNSSTGNGVWTKTIAYTTSDVSFVNGVVSLNIINGRPALSLVLGKTSGVNDELAYIRADNSDGTSWPTNFVSLNTSTKFSETYLEIVNGQPSILYIDASTGSAEFVRSNDVNGLTWGASTVAVLQVSGLSITTRADGVPIISYFKSVGGIFVKSADDINGSAWTSPEISITTTGFGTYVTNIEIIGGIPAILTKQGVSFTFTQSYFYAPNAEGVGGWAGSVIQAQSFSDTYGSLFEINNLPAVVYYSSGGAIPNKAVFATNTIINGSGTWSVSEIDQAVLKNPFSSSLAFIDGNPSVVYENDLGELIYVTGDDIHSFSNSINVVVDSLSPIGETPALEYDLSLRSIQNKPAIVYYNNTSPPSLNFATNLGNIINPWTITSIDSGAGFCSYLSLRVINGFPAVAYFNTDDNSLNFGYNNQNDGLGVWSLSVIPGTNIGTYLSLQQIDNRPAISCYDSDNDRLLFIINDSSDGSGTWTTTEVDTNGGLWTSLNIINNKPAISYVSNSSPPELKFAINDSLDGSGIWTNYTIEIGSDYQYTSLTEFNGNANISYYDASNLTQNNAINTSLIGSGEWNLFTIDTVSGQFSNSAQVDNNLSLSYKTENTLRYSSIINVTAADILFIDTSPPAPAVFYSSGSSLEVKFGNNSDGTSFGNPITIDNISVDFLSAEIINGHPALAIYSMGELKYIRSDSLDGSIWSSSPVIESIDGSPPDNVGNYNSLFEIVSNPAISYYDETNQQLKYIRSTDMNGDNWGTSYVVDNNGNVGQYTSLFDVDGMPAISYYDIDNESLKYARASAIDGSGIWTTQTIADNINSPANNVGLYISLFVFNGNPVITFYDQTNDNLLYVTSNDSTGSVWQEPSILDTNGGMFANGRLTKNSWGVSYTNNSTNQIKYISFKPHTFNVNWLATD